MSVPVFLPEWLNYLLHWIFFSFWEFWGVLELNYLHSNILYLLLLKENLVQNPLISWSEGQIPEPKLTGRLEDVLSSSLFFIFFKRLLQRNQLLKSCLAGPWVLLSSSFRFCPAEHAALQTQPEARWWSDSPLILLLLYTTSLVKVPGAHSISFPLSFSGKMTN